MAVAATSAAHLSFRRARKTLAASTASVAAALDVAAILENPDYTLPVGDVLAFGVAVDNAVEDLVRAFVRAAHGPAESTTNDNKGSV